MENLFSLKGKITGQTLNNFTIIKSITIIIMYVSRLKENFSCFSLLSYNTNYLFQRRQHFTLFFFFFSTYSFFLVVFFFSKRLPLGCSLSFFLCGVLYFCSCTYSFCVFSKAAVPYSLLPLAFLPSQNPFFLSWNSSTLIKAILLFHHNSHKE